MENTDLWLYAINKQAHQRAIGYIPTIEEYIELRRLSSACKPFFDLIEYAFDFQLPTFIIEDPLIMTLNDCANDFVAFSNVSCSSMLSFRSSTCDTFDFLLQDMFSYNAERSRGDTHNIVAIIMHHEELDLQGSIDRAGDMCRAVMDKYIETKGKLPSYGAVLDKQVAAYMQGLESWMTGNIDWSFVTRRYFGDEGAEIKRTRSVTLLRGRMSQGGQIQ